LRTLLRKMIKPLVVICGPTCTGKTSLAIKLAGEFEGEIISADSRQVYRYMDVGTGKIPHDFPLEKLKKVDSTYWFPSPTGLGEVPVHLYDLVPPNANLTVVDYARRAWEEITSCWRRSKVPFLVGGTGFYIDVVLGRSQPAGVPPNPQLRQGLEKKSLEELNQLLKELDPQRWQAIDQKNLRRLIRAIEVASSLEVRPLKPRNDAILEVGPLSLGLTAPREVLYQRANLWAREILASGALVTEVKELLERGYRQSAALQGIIYRPVLALLDGQVSAEKLLERIQFDLHGYIRRQLTWFKKREGIVWHTITEEGFDKKVWERVRSYLNG